MPTLAPSDCRRSVLSCARCRKRKIKCDRRLPCSQCKASNSACTGYSHVGGGTEVPRSIVPYLEAEIAALEKELKLDTGIIKVFSVDDSPLQSNDIVVGALCELEASSIGSIHQLNASEEHPGHKNVLSPVSEATGSDPIRQHIVASKDLRAVISATMPTGSSITDVVSRVRMGLTPSLTLSAPTRNKSQNRHIEVDEVVIPLLAGLPAQVAHGLVRKYVRMILPTFPCLYERTVWEQLDRVLQEVQKACQKSPE